MPKLTLTFVLRRLPIPSGKILVCSLLQGMTTFPSATKERSTSLSIRSFSATTLISLVTIPATADSNCVINIFASSYTKYIYS